MLEHGLELHAGNLSRGQAARVVRETCPDAVFSMAQRRELGLDIEPDAAWQQAQEREIDAGHCGALPPNMWPAMAHAHSPAMR